MTSLSARYPALPWLPGWLFALLFLFGSGGALGQTDPSMNQVYEAARAGRIDQAQTMMKQVLAAHPNSAKAHFVEAELLAQQGRIDAARESLATAERLQPGLAFATPEAVRGLRARLTGSGLNGLSGVAPRTSAGAADAPSPRSTPRVSPSAPAPAASGPSFGFFWPLLLIIGGIALFLMFRRRSAAARAAAYGGAGTAAPGYAGSVVVNPANPANPGAPGSAVGAPYGQPYGQPYAQPAQPGMGSRIAGGLATGAAIGAGMMAAQAIGRSMTGHDDHGRGHGNDISGASGSDVAPIPAGDLGGDNFGIRDSGGWDDSSSLGGGGDVGGGGGGDWDS